MNDGGSPDSAILLPALGEPPSSLDQLREALAVAGVAASVCGRGAGVRRSRRRRAPSPRVRGRRRPQRPRRCLVDWCLLRRDGRGGRCRGWRRPRDNRRQVWCCSMPRIHQLSGHLRRRGVRARQVLANPEGIDLAAALDRLGRECVPGRLDQVPLLCWLGDRAVAGLTTPTCLPPIGSGCCINSCGGCSPVAAGSICSMGRARRRPRGSGRGGTSRHELRRLDLLTWDRFRFTAGVRCRCGAGCRWGARASGCLGIQTDPRGPALR